jgi:hypothetical protein
VLEISTFELSLQAAKDGSRWYMPRIVLTEKSGTSAAQLQELVFGSSNGDRDILGGSCLAGNLGRVPAAGTWNEHQAYYACFPAYPESIAGTRVTLTVTFTDEERVEGHVAGSAIAPPPGVSSLDRK